MAVIDRLILRLGGATSCSPTPETPSESRHQRSHRAGAQRTAVTRRWHSSTASSTPCPQASSAGTSGVDRTSGGARASCPKTSENPTCSAAAGELRGARTPRGRSVSGTLRAHRTPSRAGRSASAPDAARSSRPRRSRRARRAASWRSAASARRTFWCSRTAVAKIQVYIRQDALPERDFPIFKLLDFGDFVGVDGHLFRTKTNELTIWASSLEFLAKCFIPLPEKWHGLQRRRDPLPAALPRSDRQPGFAAGLRGPQPGARGDPDVPERARLPRGRDADDAADRRRRAGAAVRHAPQRARHAAVPAHRAGAVPEAADRRRHRTGLRDQPQLPERGDLDAAQPRVHDARVLPGLQRLPGADGDDRGDALGGRARGDRHRPGHASASTQISLAPPYRRVSLREGRGEAASERLGIDGRPTPTCAIARPAAALAGAARHRGRSRAGAPGRSRPRSSSG